MTDSPQPSTSGAVFSADRVYRYTLTREWGAGPTLMVIGLNPSTADETADDPTIRRCLGFARRLGFGRMVMTNLFAFRATDPAEMRRAIDPVGPQNDAWLLHMARTSTGILAGWGVHGGYRLRDEAVMDLLAGHQLKCLGVTKDGFPKHPLYLRGDSPLTDLAS